MTPEERAQVITGVDAEEFVDSDLGKIVLGMAEQDLKEAIIAFDEIDITDRAKLLDLKVQIRTARRFDQYLAELIMRGREVAAANKPEEG